MKDRDDEDTEVRCAVDIVWAGNDMVTVALSADDPSDGGTLRSGDTERRAARRVQTALDRDRLLEEVADRAGVGTDWLLALLRREMDAAAPVPDSASAFSAAERHVLERAGVDLSGPDDGSADPAAETMARFAALIGAAPTVAQVAARLGVSAGRVRQRIAERSLHAVRLGAGEWRLPEWQFTGSGVVPGLEIVLPRVPDQLHPMAVKGFMAGPDPDLVVEGVPASPLQWLSTGGDPLRVADLADSLSSFA